MSTDSERLRRSPVPLYLQLAALIRRRIATGVWPPGHRLPTLRELLREFGVARVTVRQAMDVLHDEGLIWRRQGKGTFVARAVPDQRWLRLATDWGSLIRMIEGTSPRLLALEVTRREPRLAAGEGAPAPAYEYMKRVHSKGDEPYCVIDIYLDQRVYAKAPEAFRAQPVLPLLSSLEGVEIARARQMLTIGTADVETAALLKIPVNSPTAEVRRVITDAGGTAIYLADVVYRGDFVKLDIDLLGGSGHAARASHGGRDTA